MLNEELIEKLKNGEIAVANDGGFEEIVKVLKAAFPNDRYDATRLIQQFKSDKIAYCRVNVLNSMNWIQCYQHEIKYEKRPIISVKDFFKTFEWGEDVDVSYDCKNWFQRKFVAMNPIKDAIHKYVCCDAYGNACTWKFCRRIKNELEITVKLNGKEISPKDLTKEEWKSLRK